MKKLVILTACVLIFSACTPNVPESTKNMETQKKEEAKKTEQTKDMENIQTQSKKTVRTLPEHKDLAVQYSGALIKTTLGDVKVKFYNEDSPLTVNNFLNLAEKKFYNGTIFHRVIQDFMIQGGDPLSKEADRSRHGTGGPGYQFDDEFNMHQLVRGSLAMANSGPNTNGSQFFIVTKDATPWLDGKHTNFGYVVDGMDVVEKIEKQPTDRSDHPTEDIKILSIELLEE